MKSMRTWSIAVLCAALLAPQAFAGAATAPGAPGAYRHHHRHGYRPATVHRPYYRPYYGTYYSAPRYYYYPDGGWTW